jgi:outer membrane protein assembly factor BamD (BamD/ComL family)
MKKILLATLFVTLFNCQNLHAIKKTKYFCDQIEANIYLRTHYEKGCQFYNQGLWRLASDEFEKVIFFFPDSDEAAKSAYYLGICYFEMREYDFANDQFSNYIKSNLHPQYFEDAVYYKYCIAEHFKHGKRKRPFTCRYLPKWLSAQDLALTIYDDVITALPNHNLTICALLSKAQLLMEMKEYKKCVETYQMLIRRFPRSEAVPDCYLKISEAYYQQSRYEFQNPDILSLAELNALKFNEEFPKDARVQSTESIVCKIKEQYAKGLSDLGLFYERLKQPAAAAIYYQSAIEEFPDTQISKFCRSRLMMLGYFADEEGAPITTTTKDPIEYPNSAESALDRAVPPQGVEGAEPRGMGVPLLIEGGTRAEVEQTYHLSDE